MAIHPTAVIHPSVHLDPSNEVGPLVVIEEGAQIGLRNRFIAHCYIDRGLRLGNDNEVHPGACLGGPPQDIGHDGSETFLEIGDHNVIRENVTAHRAAGAGNTTRVGNHNFIMGNVHIGHNCVVGNHVILANDTGLGGHVEVQDRAFLSKGSACHQFTRVGRYVMLSGLSGINQDAPPFMMLSGHNAAVYGLNLVGIKRAGYDRDTRRALQEAHKILYRKGLLVKEALVELDQIDSEPVRELADFVRSSKRGIVSGIHSSGVNTSKVPGK